ncbi:BTAD domain-containing putative transcriptional regulator [Fodinicola acaciae]|uniref:BTAD domain-containing putative transcriptional regulator n=1 Tax=Fodinicola acaciae TaxID=2681555 RepID=UPI0013D77523|nr:BTAD domain-containing putative transcriptional regulator [Fodinicola acaciae]
MLFGVLGPLEVRTSAGEPIAIGGPRPRALLVMLLLNAGRVVSLEQLIDGQYGDDPPAGAANAVQAQVSRLRRTLPDGAIESHPAGYRAAVDPDEVDAHRFERLARVGRSMLAAGQYGPAAAALREGLALWRGAALTDLPYGQAQAARLEELRLAATEDLIEAEFALPEGTSIADLAALVAAHPLRERLCGQLMRALHAAGRQAEALEAYERTRRLLADELGADPSPELAEIHLALLRAEPIERPAAAPPVQLSSFVGRDADLARLRELAGARLVTILGPGGIGKTRLAVEYAASLDAVFVDLSDVDTAEAVPLAVLGALGQRESGFAPGPAMEPAARLVGVLAQRQVLLVLDNCEQIVAAVAVLVRQLLEGCPRLTVLATSREPLGLTGERLLPLAPLDTPPAVRLFADRAAAVRPGFAVDAANTAAVTEICVALDGLPLAIELAAARLRQFDVAEVAARLAGHAHFRLLSRGDRTAAARHQTLRAVVEWSWDLLDPDAQALARRLAVFVGGARLPAIEAVCGAGVEDLLADLVDRSLVESDGGRYRMLQTIRLFCAERLVEAGEDARVRAAHARCQLALAEEADPHLRRAEQLEWLARLSADHDNLMAALRWAVDNDRRTAFQLVAALAAYWWFSGRRSQATDAAVALLDGDMPDGLEEEWISCVVHAGARASAEQWKRAGELMERFDRPLRHPFGAALWGMTAGPPDGDATETHGVLLDADPWNVALGRLSTVLLGLLGGEPTAEEPQMRAALASFRELGERWGTAQALDWLGVLASWRAEWDNAYAAWDEAYDLQARLGASEECASILCHRAESLVRQGELVAARAEIERASALLAEAGELEVPVEIQLGFAEVARLRGDLETAADLLRRTLAATEGHGFGAEWLRGRVLTACGRLAAATGDVGDSVRRHGEALAFARTSPFAVELAHAVEGVADGATLVGAYEQAALLLGIAVALRGMAVVGDPDVARTAAAATTAIGPGAFAAAYARGVAMNRDEALAVLDNLRS